MSDSRISSEAKAPVCLSPSSLLQANSRSCKMAGELSALHFRSLRATLASLPASAGDPALAHHLRLQLERSRPAFRRLLDKPAPNQKEKDELEKCACWSGGTWKAGT